MFSSNNKSNWSLGNYEFPQSEFVSRTNCEHSSNKPRLSLGDFQLSTYAFSSELNDNGFFQISSINSRLISSTNKSSLIFSSAETHWVNKSNDNDMVVDNTLATLNNIFFMCGEAICKQI